MAATIQSSLNKSETDFLEENLENCAVENQYFLGFSIGKETSLRICSRGFFF